MLHLDERAMSKGNGTLYGYTVEIRNTSFSVHSTLLRLPDGTLVGPEWQNVTFHEGLNPAGVPGLDGFDNLGIISDGLVPYDSAVALAAVLLAQFQHHAYKIALRIIEHHIEYTYEKTQTGVVGEEITSKNRYELTVTAEEDTEKKDTELASESSDIEKNRAFRKRLQEKLAKDG